MGTWGIGPFANDTAADFADDLDEAVIDERTSIIRTALERAAHSTEQLETPDAERAVAAVALIVAQHPDGEPAMPEPRPLGATPGVR